MSPSALRLLLAFVRFIRGIFPPVRVRFFPLLSPPEIIKADLKAKEEGETDNHHKKGRHCGPLRNCDFFAGGGLHSHSGRTGSVGRMGSVGRTGSVGRIGRRCGCGCLAPNLQRCGQKSQKRALLTVYQRCRFGQENAARAPQGRKEKKLPW